MADTLINIGGLAVAQGANTLTTLGLGSCIGLCLLDRTKQIGGMAHIMLPQSPQGRPDRNPKYADVAFEELMSMMIRAGANPRLLAAKVVGGAHMFGGAMDSDVMKVGERNIEAVQKLLANYPIGIAAQEVGGTVGRTIVLHCDSGQLLVRTAFPRTEKYI
ncbi:chemotaxis protein CheD [Eubacteriales bacterium OttesenSCG-928-M02]|nr:chemotaxis protein CheD [Eubacteriales bacterium OttesenSCG-928-M02]